MYKRLCEINHLLGTIKNQVRVAVKFGEPKLQAVVDDLGKVDELMDELVKENKYADSVR